MVRSFLIGLAAVSLIGCCQSRAPVYDPFAGSAPRIPPPATGALNQTGGAYQAPAYQAPAYTAPPTFPPAATQPPALSAPPYTPSSQTPPGFAPATSTAPARLTPVSRTAIDRDVRLASGRSQVPTPQPTESWPPRRLRQTADDLVWQSPNVPGGVQQVSAETPLRTATNSPRYAPTPDRSVQPSTYWTPEDPYLPRHVVNPLLPMPQMADSVDPYRGAVGYPSNSGTRNWRERSSPE